MTEGTIFGAALLLLPKCMCVLNEVVIIRFSEISLMSNLALA